MTQPPLQTYTIHPAKYAKGKMAIHCVPDGTGWRTLADLIITGMKNVRYSNRERAYIVSPRCAENFKVEVAKAENRRADTKLIEEAHASGRAIGHIDGNPTNNDLANLRVVTRTADL